MFGLNTGVLNWRKASKHNNPGTTGSDVSSSSVFAVSPNYLQSLVQVAFFIFLLPYILVNSFFSLSTSLQKRTLNDVD